MIKRCTKCGKSHEEEHSNLCKECFREHRSEYMRSYKHKRIEKKECVVCGLEPQDGKTLCKFCAELQNAPRRKANRCGMNKTSCVVSIAKTEKSDATASA